MAKKRQEILLQMRSGVAEFVLATVVNEAYAYHAHTFPRSKFWAITHIPTGLLVTIVDSAAQAKELAELLPEETEVTEELLAAIAQLVEQSFCKRKVVGSSPTGGSKEVL